MITAEEKKLVEEVLGFRKPQRAYEDYLEAAALSSKRDALAALLDDFDSVCDIAGVKYFLFADALKGADVYEDFLPKAKKIQVGILSSEMKKLYEYTTDVANRVVLESHSVKLSYLQNDGCPRRFPRVDRPAPVNVVFRGEDVFGPDSFPMVVSPYIELSIFTAMPDDFLVKRGFVRAMRRRNLLLERASKAHSAIRKSKKKILGVNGLYAMVPRRALSKSLFKCSVRYEGEGSSSVSCMFGKRTKQMPIEALGNYRRVVFHGVEAWAPEFDTPWDVVPVDEPNEELRRLQELALDIVSEIHRVCDVLGIGYFVCGGTMLGYVRHGGFIPWDDDIDVGMLRKDYDLFLEKAPDVIDSERFFIQTRETDPFIPYLFSKVRMNNTQYVTNYNQFRDFHKGICVDLFPFDYIPNEVPAQREFRDQIRVVEKRHNTLANHQYTEAMIAPDDNLPTTWHSRLARLIGKVSTKRYWKTPLSETQKAFDQLVRKYDEVGNEGELRYVACFVPSYTMVKVENLLPYKAVDFEGVKVNVPKNPEAFLRMQYGDFTEMPLPHQRVGHDLIEFGEDED